MAAGWSSMSRPVPRGRMWPDGTGWVRLGSQPPAVPVSHPAPPQPSSARPPCRACKRWRHPRLHPGCFPGYRERWPVQHPLFLPPLSQIHLCIVFVCLLPRFALPSLLCSSTLHPNLLYTSTNVRYRALVPFNLPLNRVLSRSRSALF